MREAELNELCSRIATQLDVYVFLDILGYTMEELVFALKDVVNDYTDEFEDCLNDT